MNNTFKISRYLIRDSRKALIIFYSIILVIAISLASINTGFSTANANVRFGGFGLSTAIFLFVTALNFFRPNYKFMQSLNISRKRFYFGSIIGLITLSLFMSLIDVAMTKGLQSFAKYESIFEQLYGKGLFINDFFWTLALFIYVASLGWLITMLYYRCNKVMKVVISIIPVLSIILISIIDDFTSISIWENIGNFLARIFGFANGLNSYMAVITFIIGSMICFGLSFLLIRKATIKD